MTTTVRRRRTAPVRRRQYTHYALGRSVTFGPAVAVPWWGWAYLSQPLHWAGLGAMLAAGLIVIPSLIVGLVFFAPSAVRGCVPRDWRKKYRKSHGDRNGQRSAYISRSLRRVTFAADRHRCVACRSRIGDPGVDHLEWDHTMPWSLGGLTTLFNGMTLCPRCNKIKSNYWRFKSGNRVYVPFPGWANEIEAAAILRCELRHRWNPFRLVRAAWAMG